MTTYPISSPQYILLRKSLEQQFPNSLIFVSVLVAWESGGQSGLQDPPRDLEGSSLPPLISTIPSPGGGNICSGYRGVWSVCGWETDTFKEGDSEQGSWTGREAGAPRGWETYMSVLFPFCAQNGDGFVDEVKLQTIVNLLNEELKKKVAGN